MLCCSKLSDLSQAWFRIPSDGWVNSGDEGALHSNCMLVFAYCANCWKCLVSLAAKYTRISSRSLRGKPFYRNNLCGQFRKCIATVKRFVFSNFEKLCCCLLIERLEQLDFGGSLGNYIVSSVCVQKIYQRLYVCINSFLPFSSTIDNGRDFNIIFWGETDDGRSFRGLGLED